MEYASRSDSRSSGLTLRALCIGVVASILGFFAIRALHNWRDMDDTLDVFAVHGVGGIWGAFATGIFAVNEIGGVDGLIGGSADLLWKQIVGIVAALAWSFVLSAAIFWVVQKFMPLRVEETDEMIGLDRSTHNEPAYEYDEIGFGWDASDAIDEEIPSGTEALKRLLS